eukprot:gene24774-50207_t
MWVLGGFAGASFKSVHTPPLTRLTWRIQISLFLCYPRCALVLALPAWWRLGAAGRSAVLTTRQLGALAAVSAIMLGMFTCWNLLRLIAPGGRDHALPPGFDLSRLVTSRAEPLRLRRHASPRGGGWGSPSPPRSPWRRAASPPPPPGGGMD